jgi:hypothetical protein
MKNENLCRNPVVRDFVLTHPDQAALLHTQHFCKIESRLKAIEALLGYRFEPCADSRDSGNALGPAVQTGEYCQGCAACAGGSRSVASSDAGKPVASARIADRRVGFFFTIPKATSRNLKLRLELFFLARKHRNLLLERLVLELEKVNLFAEDCRRSMFGNQAFDQVKQTHLEASSHDETQKTSGDDAP